MLATIKLGPKLLSPVNFSRVEARVVQSEHETFINDILQGCRDNPTPSTTSREDAIMDIAQQRHEEFARAVNEHQSKRRRPPLDGELLEEAIDRHAEIAFVQQNLYYFGRQDEPVNGTFHLTFNLASGQAPSLSVNLKSAEEAFNKNARLPLNPDKGILKAFITYWDYLAQAPAKGSGVDAIASFDKVRAELHGNKFLWGDITGALGDMGFVLGGKLSTGLFALLATAYPDTRNPFPEMILNAHRTAAERAGQVFRI